MVVYLFSYWHDSQWNGFVGASVKIWDMAHFLNELGHEIVLFIPKSGVRTHDATFRVIEVPVAELPGFRMISFNLCLILTLMLSSSLRSPDIVYLRRTTTLVPALLSVFSSAAFFFEINDDPFYSVNRQSGASLIHRLRRITSGMIDEINLRLCRRAFVITDELIRKIRRRLPGIEPQKLVLMPSGANADLLVPMRRTEAMKKTMLSPEYFYVGFVGTLLPHQGVETLIAASRRVLQIRPDCRFLIVGEGPMRRSWETEAERFGLSGAYMFTGQIDYQDIFAWINAMDLCIAPYAADAGLRSPVKIFDYLACGRPVVASNIRGTTDVFKDTQAVLLVEPGCPEQLSSAILRLLKAPEMRNTMGTHGRRWIEKHFNRKKNALTVSKEIESVVRP